MDDDTMAAARRSLLEPNALDERALDRVFTRLLKNDIDFADLYFQVKRSESWRLEEGVIKSGDFDIVQGVGVRAIAGDRTALAYSDDLSLGSINEAADTARAIADSATERRSFQTPARGAAIPRLYGVEDPLAAMSAKQKTELLLRIDQRARSRDPRIQQCNASVSASHEVILVARSDGALAADIRPLVRVSVQVTAEQNGRRETASSGGGGRFSFAELTQDRIDQYVDQAVDEALVKLDARPAPAGSMSVVLGPGWPGILLHEAVGHGLEGDFNRKRSSMFAGRIGERVAAKGVSVVDDGALAGRRGSLTIDDEGNPTERTLLIEDGVLVGYMQDMLNAQLMGGTTTGNARRESFAAMPVPRMTNTFMTNGALAPEEIIASVKHGVYAVNFSGGQVDITSGKFVFDATAAFLIEDGRITAPIKGATLIGSGAESLREISLIGNDMALDEGIAVCGKDGQNVPVGVGQPTLRIDNMTVGGSA
jgi:TldD protein